MPWAQLQVQGILGRVAEHRTLARLWVQEALVTTTESGDHLSDAPSVHLSPAGTAAYSPTEESVRIQSIRTIEKL